MKNVSSYIKTIETINDLVSSMDIPFLCGTIAINAIKKQIPQKPIIKKLYITDSDLNTKTKEQITCPECNNSIRRYLVRNDFCNKCGQAIDFSE